MSNYFSYFPTIPHDLTNVGETIDVTNILKRFRVKPDIKEEIGTYYDYLIQPGDRPDIIAQKYYGNGAYAWIVILFNEIADPVMDWPMFDRQFIDFLESKYGSLSLAQNTVHEYRRILRDAYVDIDGSRYEKLYVVVDQTSYEALGESEREMVTKYDYEEELNETKRKIKILDKRYLTQIKNEVKTILRD